LPKSSGGRAAVASACRDRGCPCGSSTPMHNTSPDPGAGGAAAYGLGHNRPRPKGQLYSQPHVRAYMRTDPVNWSHIVPGGPGFTMCAENTAYGLTEANSESLMASGQSGTARRAAPPRDPSRRRAYSKRGFQPGAKRDRNSAKYWSEWLDLNLRAPRPEPGAPRLRLKIGLAPRDSRISRRTHDGTFLGRGSGAA